MGVYSVGRLTSVPVSEACELVGAPTLAALERLGLVDAVGVVEIDPDLSDTARNQEAYDLPPETLANCVVVAGKREGVEKVAACMVLADAHARRVAQIRRFRRRVVTNLRHSRSGLRHSAVGLECSGRMGPCPRRCASPRS